MSSELDVNAFTTPFQLTKSLHRDVYPAVDPENLGLYAEGKVIVVIGAAGGLGYATAKTWSKAGAKGVVLVGRNLQKLQDVASSFNGPTLVAAGDIANEDDVKKIFTSVLDRFGTVDVIVNASGIGLMGVIGEVEPGTWWKHYELIVRGTYNLVHHFIQSTGGKGTFINLVSLSGALLAPAMSSYGTSQLAAIRLGEFVHLEQPNLRYFSVHPGVVEAEESRGMVIDQFTPFAKDKQILTAGVTLYLQKPEADFLRGGFLSVNWDVEELEEHKKEIEENKLTGLAFVKGKLGPEGHPWKS